MFILSFGVSNNKSNPTPVHPPVEAAMSQMNKKSIESKVDMPLKDPVGRKMQEPRFEILAKDKRDHSSFTINKLFCMLLLPSF